MGWTRIARRQNLSEEVAEQIVAQILGGVLQPGDRLPIEPVLCQTLGVSRTALREGLRPLVILGLIEIRQGDGTYVSSNPSEFFAKPLTWGLLVGERNVSQMVEARELLETGTAAMAARRATDEEIAKLAALLDEMENRIHDIDAFLDRDLAFHVLIAEMSHNAVLARLVLSIRGLLRPWIARVAAVPGDAREAIRLHRQVLLAIQSRDSSAAQAAMAEHTQVWGKRLTDLLATTGMQGTSERGCEA